MLPLRVPASPCPVKPGARRRVSQRAVPELTAVGAYTPPPVEAWQLYVGAAAGFFPFAVATYEFGKRIVIQRECKLCGGSGLIQRTQWGEKRELKCTACGGFLPWKSWSLFLTSEVGNGGKLRFPKGQTSVLFDVDAAREASERAAAAAAGGEESGEEERES